MAYEKRMIQVWPTSKSHFAQEVQRKDPWFLEHANFLTLWNDKIHVAARAIKNIPPIPVQIHA